MYAIIKTGGKQYRVAIGDIIDVELVEGEIGGQVHFEEVLLVADGSNTMLGEPNLADYLVTGELIDAVAGPKVVSMKYIPGNHRKKIGHRQHYSRVKITQIGSHTRKKGKEGKHHGT